MTHDTDRSLSAALAAARDAGRPCALATVVATRGSTPRKVGARMLIDPERGLVGTVGGGCGEAEVIDAARDVLASGSPRRVLIDLRDDFLSWSPAVCGGTMDVFVEAVEAVAAGDTVVAGETRVAPAEAVETLEAAEAPRMPEAAAPAEAPKAATDSAVPLAHAPNAGGPRTAGASASPGKKPARGRSTGG